MGMSSEEARGRKKEADRGQGGCGEGTWVLSELPRKIK